MFRRTARVLVMAALAIAAPMPAPAQVELPSIGDPADRALSPRQEAEIGREMMARARQQLAINKDPEIAAYVESVGQRLARQANTTPLDGFTFFVIHNPRVNAFAAPGGYIGIHSGLMLRADNEAQLAGVLAHEITHVTQRHIAQAYAANQRNSYKTLAAVLAGLILGAQDPQAGQAAMATGIAVERQRQINYTRSNEYEADRLGIRILADAGYDPGGMAAMFDILMESAGASADAVPEYLRTHPLSANRVAEAKDRAARMDTTGTRRDTLAFHLMRTRLQVEEADEPGRLASRWRAEDGPGGEHAAAARRYGLALLALRDDRPEEAAEALRALREDDRDNLHYGLALARAERALGEFDAALETWQRVRSLHPSSFAAAVTGAELMLAADRAGDAVELMTSVVRGDEAVPPEAWRHLAQAADAADRPVRSHEALGEYYTRTDRLDQGLHQFQLAYERAETGSSQALRLEARIEQVRELRRERLARNPLEGD